MIKVRSLEKTSEEKQTRPRRTIRIVKHQATRTRNAIRVTLDESRSFKGVGYARKSAGWMPWHWEPKKDVISCEKLRGGANDP